MTHAEIEQYIKPILDGAYNELLDDVTKATYICVVAKLYHNLYEIPEDQLKWLNEEELREMILTIYYAVSRQRHALTVAVTKEVKKYVKSAYKDWRVLRDIAGEHEEDD